MTARNTTTWWPIVAEHRPTTYVEVLRRHLQYLVSHPDIGNSTSEQAIDTVCETVGPWATEDLAAFSGWKAWAANDGAPVEFSFAFTRAGSQVRVGYEPSELRATGRAYAGEEDLRRLAKLPQVDLQRFDAVRDLFIREGVRNPFMVATALSSNKPPLYKGYLYLESTGEPALAAVSEALDRLGFRHQWQQVLESLGTSAFTDGVVEPALIALDLDPAPEARVKVYLRQLSGDLNDVERVSSTAADYQQGLYRQILTQLIPTPFDEWDKQPMTCLALRSTADAPTVATYCPLEPNLPNDAESAAAIERLFAAAGVPTNSWDAVKQAITGTKAQTTRRINWVSLKNADDPVITVYAGLHGTEVGAAE